MKQKNNHIPIHTKEDFEKMRIIGRYSCELLNEIENIIKPNITTQDIEDYAIKFIQKHKLISACLGYKGSGTKPFPKNICTSVNHVICHGIPNENNILKEGDIISVDVTLIKDGYYGDTCRTFKVGEVSNKANELIKITEQAMYKGIEALSKIEDNYTSDIGDAIESFIKGLKNKYYIVVDYCGHGIGKKFHQPPQIEHVKQEYLGDLIKPGMIFTVEPMINLGTEKTVLLKDGWTVITKDFTLSAQFEHTIGFGDNGIEIFTK